tara:strand:+ start:3834 stop:4295 length:462 start_codon:yes stop_codon:yes gene_type:complete
MIFGHLQRNVIGEKVKVLLRFTNLKNDMLPLESTIPLLKSIACLTQSILLVIFDTTLKLYHQSLQKCGDWCPAKQRAGDCPFYLYSIHICISYVNICMPNHEHTEAEVYRKMALNLESRVKILEQEVASEQVQKYNAYKRINELTEKLNSYKS